MNVTDGVIELVYLADNDLEGGAEREIRAVADVKGELVDVFDGGIVFVCVTEAVEVLEGAILLLDVLVFKGFVIERRALDDVVFDVLIDAVVVVEAVSVFVPVIVLETVGEADVVLVDDIVPVVVRLLRVLGVLLELADPLGEPVDVLEPTIERVSVDEPEVVFDGGRDLDIVGEPVLVFEVLTLPVDVFVRGCVFVCFAEDVVVRLAAIV